jgi:hypothetical protein
MSHVNKITEILFSNDNKLDLIKELNDKEIIALKAATGGIELDEIDE